MNYKSFIKILTLLFIGLNIIALILFFVFIAPHKALPILSYHLITSGEQKYSPTLSEEIFKRQMKYLSKHNYYVVSLTQAACLIREGLKIPNNWIVITFDDGAKDFYIKAYPILKKHKFKTTVFITFNSIGEKQGDMNWDEIMQLSSDALIDIGAHTLSHKILPLLSQQEAKKEIFLSKIFLEERLKKPVVSFCYPYGAVDDSTKEMVKEAGFSVAVGTTYQHGQFRDNDIYVLRRIYVSKISEIPFMFKFMISGYYVPTREFILKVLDIRVPRILYADKKDKDKSTIGINR